MSEILWHPKAKRIRMEDSGTIGNGGPKFVVHTAEGKDLDTIVNVLREKRAAPHFILGVDHGKRQLVQCMPIDRGARALMHTFPAETNRANAIQVELLEYAKNAQHWDSLLYHYLHLLWLWCHRHGGVPMEAHHPFYGQPGYHRLSPGGWVRASGLVGHCHCPGNDHWDPGNMNTERALGA